ncbi:MAG: VCBS repeat-containing protein [Nocardioides sp.]
MRNTLHRQLARFLFATTTATLAVSVALPASAVPVPDIYDRAGDAGLFAVQRTWSGSTVDFDNDGDQDVFIGHHQRVDSKLWSNDGDGTYTLAAVIKRVNDQGGILDRHDCAWSDVDHNGLKDLYCSGGRNNSNYVKTAVKDNELWLQGPVGTFTDVGTQWGIGDACGRGRYVAFLDVNGDGWDDLFLGNQSGRNVTDPCDDPANGYPNEESKLFINTAGTGLVYDRAWNVTRADTGVSCALPMDYDKDGLMDLLACNFKTTRPQLYRNTGTGFVDVGTTIGLTAITDAVLGDVSGDGIEDLVMSDTRGFLYRRGTATGLGPAVRLYTSSSTTTTGIGGEVAVGDINNDGLLDIYGMQEGAKLTNPNPPDKLFVNNGDGTFLTVVPPAATGQGEAVISLAPAAGAGAQFLVLNGQEGQDGPIQLIAERLVVTP